MSRTILFRLGFIAALVMTVMDTVIASRHYPDLIFLFWVGCAAWMLSLAFYYAKEATR